MLDYCEFESLLTAEERILRGAIHRWVEERVRPIVGDCFERGEFPSHLVPEMAELGLLGVDLPAEYGCSGGSPVDYGLAMRELERGDSGVRSFCSVQGSLCMYPILRYGSEEQRRRYLPEMAAGRVIGCFGLTEADFGSNPGGMVTRARREGDRYIINGTKMWITNGSIAHVALVWAKVEGEVRGFLVEAGTPGFGAREIDHKLSLRASVTSELVLEDCAVPAEAMLPQARGLGAPLSCLNQARYGIAWGAIGVMEDCYRTALEYAKERRQFSRPIAGYQMTQEKLVTMATEITKAQMLTLQVGRLAQAGRMTGRQVSLIKRNNVYWALECARMARTILGANGITTAYSPLRHACNMETVITYEGTHEIHTLILGHDLTGLAAFE